MEIAELIAKLEAAIEGSADLDLRIFRTITPEDQWFRHDGCVDQPPNYTTSLDAALTLVPEWASYELTFSAAGEGALRRAHLWDWRRSPPAFDPGNKWKSEGKQLLPIHVCIAALRARSAA